ncbi:MAG: response regulator [Oligoflexales bacterium]
MQTVLIVDDDESILEYLAMRLQGPYEVSSAKGPIEGFARFIDQQPDLVIVDLMMPFLDGYGLIDKIEAAGYNPKFMILTGAPNLVRTNETYADITVLIKPFSDRVFIDAVEKAFTE